MEYLGELRAKWRPLLAALIGTGSGLGLSQYTTSLLVPLFVKDLGWSMAAFAKIGSLSIFVAIVFPFIGRLTDVLGVKKTALIGVISYPVANIILSQMGSDMRVYIAMFIFQAVFCITTTVTVYSRIVVQHIINARGLALGMVAAGPAIVGLTLGPVLNNFAEAHGWRAGYIALAIFTGVGGAIALLLMPSETKDVNPATKPARRRARDDYPVIFRTPTFWVLAVAMLLVNMPQVITLTQFKVVLVANGITATDVGYMLSVLAFGMLTGRFVSGFAIDHMPAHIVATIGLALPAIGLFLLASNMDSYPVVLAAVLLLGLSYGAEADVVGYIVARNFGVGVYSSVYGLLTMIISSSSSLGTYIYSEMLERTGTYTLFLIVSGVAVLIGAFSFQLLPRQPKPVDGSVPAEAKAAAA